MTSARARLSPLRRWAALSAVCTLIAVLLGTGAVPVAVPAAAQPTYPSPAPTAPEAGPTSEAQDGEETAGADADIAPAGVDVTFDEVTPVIEPDGTLRITGRIINSGTEEITDPRLDFTISRRVLDSRDAINSWKDQPLRYRLLGDTTSAAQKRAAEEDADSSDADEGDAEEPTLEIDALPETIGPKSEATFALTADAETLDLPRSRPLNSWGAYGLAVALTSEDAEAAEELSITRTAFTTWYPDPQLMPSRVTFLVPVTLPGFDPGGRFSAEALEEAAGPDGALSSALSAVTAADEVAIALDPRLLGSVEDVLGITQAREAEADSGNGDGGPGSGSDDKSANEGSAPPASGAESPSPQGGSADQSPASPPSEEAGDGNGDGNGEGSGEGDQSPAPSQRAEQFPQLSGWYSDFVDAAQQRTVITLPYADADLTALDAASQTGLRAAAEAESDSLLTTLPEARTDIIWPASGSVTRSFVNRTAEAGDQTMIVSDIQQPSARGYTSSAVSTLAVADAEAGLNSLAVDTGLSEAAAIAGPDDTKVLGVSELIAESSAITTERPFDPRSLLITLPRQAAGPHWAEAISQTAAAPWIELQSFEELRDSEPVQRAPLADPTRDAAERAAGLRRLGEAQATAEEAAAAFGNPASVRGRLTRAALTCTSTAWAGVGDDASFGSCVDSAEAEVAELTGGIRPDEGSAVLLVTGEKTTIPVRIDNATREPAHVMARVVPKTPQLRTEVSEPVVISPGEQARVEVPVEGLANADVQTRIELIAAAPPGAAAAADGAGGADGAGEDAAADSAPALTSTAEHYVLPKTTGLTVRVRTDWENIGAAVIGAGLFIVLLVGLYSSVSRGRRKIPKSQLDAAVARAHENDPG